MSFYSGGVPKLIKPSASSTAFTFLARPDVPCSSAWLLAKAGINANGPLEVQLYNTLGQALSDVASVNSSTQPSRVKFTKCKIPASSFPPVIEVRVTNRSNVPRSDASVQGVLLDYTAAVVEDEED